MTHGLKRGDSKVEVTELQRKPSQKKKIGEHYFALKMLLKRTYFMLALRDVLLMISSSVAFNDQ